MKVKHYSALAFLAILGTFTACQELNELSLFNANAKKQKPTVVMREIATGSPIKGSNGINFGPDGNLYIGSFAGEEIVVMNKLNGKILKRFGPADGVKGADDLVFGSDGSLYWTDIVFGEVGKMTPEGVVTKQFVAPGVNPITFSDDGRLFVGLDFIDDGLFELDPDLINPPRHIVESTLATPYPLGFLNAFDFGPDGFLYGPIFTAGLIVKVDVGEEGDAPTSNPYGDVVVDIIADGLIDPVAVKFDSKGVLHAIDQSGQVFKIDYETKEKTLIAQLEPGLDNLAFDENDALYISNADHGWIGELLPNGVLRTISPGGMIVPQGLAVLPGANNQDALFVADLFRTRKFNGLTGKQENYYKGYLVPKPGGLTTAFTVSADEDNLVVSSWFSNLVQVWNPQSDQVSLEYEIPTPINAIGFKNDIAVATFGLGGVVFASDNSMILPIDNSNVIAPSGLATDGETLWVADWVSGKIWKIEFDGKTPKTPTILATGLSFPEGLAWNPDGSLVVVETGTSRLSRVDLATGEVTKIVEGLSLSGAAPEGFPPTYYFDGVAVGNSGDIYVTGGGKNVIYRVSKY